MAPRTLLAGFVLSALFLSGCQPAPAARDGAAQPQESGVSADAPVVTAATITSVTDAGYPMFVVKVSIAGQPAPLELLLNAEEADLGGTAPDAFSGKTATLAYTTVPETSLTDIRLDGASLLGGEAPAVDPSWSVVTGVLSGADDVTSSDLPGQIEITDAAGAKVRFEYFVDRELVAANGKQVTGYYVTGTTTRVTSMKLASP